MIPKSPFLKKSRSSIVQFLHSIFWYRAFYNSVIYWPFTELKIKRCSCVNKRKKKRKQVDVMKEHRQALAAVELVGDRKAGVRASLQTECCGPQRPPGEQPQPRCRRSVKCVLEDITACYGQEKKLGQYSSLPLSPPICHTLQKSQLQ